MRALRASGLWLLLAGVACSATLGMRPPAKIDPGSYPECGVAPGALAADVTALILSLAVVGLAVADSDGGDDSGATLLFAATGIGFGASAVNGLLVGNACREARLQAGPTLEIGPLLIRPAPPASDGGAAPDAGVSDAGAQPSGGPGG